MMAIPTHVDFIDPQTSLLMELLQTSSLLRRVIPSVRQLALLETIRKCCTFEAAKQMVLENMAGSPYIPDERKNELVESVLLEHWDNLRQMLQCPCTNSTPHMNLSADFQMFRAMVVAMFSRSRKIRALPEARRFQLGAAIHNMTTVEDLKEFAMHSLEQSTVLTVQDRQQIANDLFDDRYDLLLLPDRFDCDDKPRQHPEARTERQQGAQAEEAEDEENECPTCLGTNVVDRRLQCGHGMCHSCLDQWAARSRSSQFTCPMCRAICCRSQVQSI